jgi:Universal stress protein family.
MSPPVLVVGTGIVALGAVWYLVYARRRDTDEGLLPRALRTRRDAVGGLLPQPLQSQATPDRPTPYRVAVPIANPDTQRQLLRLAAAVAQTHADDDYPPGVVPERPELVAINVVETDSSAGQNVESDRLEQQRELLETTREVAAGLDVTLETHSIVAPEAGPAIVDTVESVEPDQLLVGWRGDLERRDHVFGRTLDPILKTVPCDVSLVNVPEDRIGTPVALAGPGPHAPAAAERAAEFAEVNDSTPVLLNVQSPGHSAGLSAEERGHRAIEWIADRAGLGSGRYDAEVVVADDTEAAIVEAVQAHGTVCVGLSEKATTLASCLARLPSRSVRRWQAMSASFEGRSEPPLMIRMCSTPLSPPATLGRLTDLTAQHATRIAGLLTPAVHRAGTDSRFQSCSFWTDRHDAA